MSRRGRLVAEGLIALVAAAATVFVLNRGPNIIKPDNPCATPPPLQRFHGVTLQPLAMHAYRRANMLAGRLIAVIQSYRSCKQQAEACVKVCGVASGCKDRCAKPGTSYHQLGAAIDVSQAMLDSTKVVMALKDAGWCQSVPASDPGHWSYGGCH
ncbi:MAG TPA: hypothetical protein DIT48_00830 [Actinobacteria bacterium]|jgi:hypothetical protein|nr:hypothetical protein [Actinomycetota bacterium]